MPSKMAETRLMPTTARPDEQIILEAAQNLVKKLQAKGIPEEASRRSALSSIIRSIASQVGYQLPFEDEKSYGDVGAESSIVSVEQLAGHYHLLDQLYERLVSQAYRKQLGQFLTPPPISRFMISWGMDERPMSILDPAVGTGVFLEDALQLHDCKVTGMDVDTLALNVCALRLRLAKPSATPSLTRGDFLRSNFITDKFDFIVCNPPYLNFHDFDGGLIRTIEQRTGFHLSKLINIYSLFFLQAYAFLRKGGVMAFITPSEFFYTGYGKQLKSFLLDRFTIEAFVITDFSKLAFRDVLTTSVITLLRKIPPDKNHKVKFIQVSKWPPFYDLLALVKGKKTQLAGCRLKTVRQDRLNPHQKWQIHLGDNGLGGILKILVPLSKVATVNRGIATGANSYFTVSEIEVQKWGLDSRFLRPVIARASQAPYYDYTLRDFESLRATGQKCFLLSSSELIPPSALRPYLKYGESLGVHERYLPSHRSPWYSSEGQEPAPILAMVFSRERMRFVYNEANLLTLTAYHCVYPYSQEELTIKALLAYLNSGLCSKVQELMRREYGGGLHKFEPRDLEELLVLDVTSLPFENRKRLADLFDKLRETVRAPVTFEAAVRTEIDAELQSILSLQTD